MKVQIESSLLSVKAKNFELYLITLDEIISRALQATTFSELKKFFESIKTNDFEYGFGSNHCWVRIIGANDRLLFITM
jgi:hypothetical protein